MKLRNLLLVGLLLAGGYQAVQAGIQDWSTTAGNNNASPPNGAPENMAPSAVNNTMRENMAQVRKWAEQAVSGTWNIDGGSANAYYITPQIIPSSLVSGQVFRFKAANANTGDSTLTVGGLSTISVVKLSGSVLESGDIGKGSVVTVVYDGTLFHFIPNTEYVDGAVTAAITAAVGDTVQADLDLVSQAEAEAGTAITERVWSALRVGQAISALASSVTSETFTSSDTWTKPSTGVRVEVQCWGGGGSGGSDSTGNGGGGGGGGAYIAAAFPIASLSATEAVTIGAGGTGVSGDTDGNTGGNTTFGSHLTAYGGGAGGGNGNGSGGGGGGALAAGGDASTTTAGAGGAPDGGSAGSSSVGGSAGLGGAGGGDSSASAFAGGAAVYGGGGGGSGTDGAITAGGDGGDSIFAGAGGGGAAGDDDNGAGGTSSVGGNGGAGNGNGGDGVDGTQPGGGGGGTEGGTSGAGAAGQCIVTVF